MFCQTILVVIRNNKATQHKKETYSNKAFFKKMSIKKIFYDVTMGSKYH